MIRRGEIYYVECAGGVGAEMKKNRPGVIMSANALNEMSGTVMVALCSMSEQQIGAPYIAQVEATGEPSNVICYKIDTVDASRLGKYMGKCTAQEMRTIEKAVLASLDLPDKASEVQEAMYERETELRKEIEDLYHRVGSSETKAELYRELIISALRG